MFGIEIMFYYYFSYSRGGEGTVIFHRWGPGTLDKISNSGEAAVHRQT